MMQNGKIIEGQFVGCSVCSSKPGSPVLCNSCLHNRELISKLKQEIKKLKNKNKRLKDYINEYHY